MLLAVSVMAEPRALGLRVGADIEASYQHFLNDNYLQLDLGLNGYKGVGTVITYNFTRDFATNWVFSYGFGIGGGYDWYKSHEWRHKYYEPVLDASGQPTGTEKRHVEYTEGKAGYFGIVANLALEVQIASAPIAIDLNYRPLIGVMVGDSKPEGYREDKLTWAYFLRGLWDVTLGIRYLF